jgi:uncharacterized protein YgiM (DUF1202 family)
MKSKKLPSVIWLITIIATLILLTASVGLLVQATSLKVDGVDAYIKSTNPTIYLQSEANPASHIVTILKRDTKVKVIDMADANGQIWLYVTTETTAGWVPVANVGLDTH